MTLIEIAKRRPRNGCLIFRDTKDYYVIDPSGYFLHPDKRIVKLDEKFLFGDYQLICDHEKVALSVIDGKKVRYVCRTCCAPMQPTKYNLVLPGEKEEMEVDTVVMNYPSNNSMSHVEVL